MTYCNSRHDSGHVYLVQRGDHVATRTPIYKIGRSRDIHQRLKRYPRGTHTILVASVNTNVCGAETAIKKALAVATTPRWDIGYEYFYGDVDKIRRVFWETVEPFLSISTSTAESDGQRPTANGLINNIPTTATKNAVTESAGCNEEVAEGAGCNEEVAGQEGHAYEDEWDNSFMDGHHLLSYDDMKMRWEKHVFKVVQGGYYVREDRHAKRVVMTDKVLNDSYKHLHYIQCVTTAPSLHHHSLCDSGSENDSDNESIGIKNARLLTLPRKPATATVTGLPRLEIRPFIARWSRDPLLRKYTNLVFKPPPLQTPADTYNIWNGFAVQRYHPPQHNNPHPPPPPPPHHQYINMVDSAAEFFLDFFYILCGRNRVTTDYVLDWIAHIFQKPSKKNGIALVMRGEQGCGKNRATDLITYMLGQDKSLNTATPKTTLFGDFTQLREGRFLIVINEANAGDNFTSCDIIKDMITSDTFVCNAKNQNAYSIDCYARFVFTTNNDNCIKLESGDRRFVIVDVSSELKGNTEYFNRLSALMDDERSRYEFYQHLMCRSLESRDWIKDRPISDAFLEMVSSSLEYEYHFFKDRVLSNNYSNDRTTMDDDVDACTSSATTNTNDNSMRGGVAAANATATSASSSMPLLEYRLDDLFREFKEWMVDKGPTFSKHNTSLIKFGQKMTKLVYNASGRTGFRAVTKKRSSSGIIYCVDFYLFLAEMVDKRWVSSDEILYCH
jgi:hypothetical protein